MKQAEKIFQTPWLKARNDRINLHALLFAGIDRTILFFYILNDCFFDIDSNNIDALVDAIKLTRNMSDVNQKQLFTSAVR